MKKRYVYGAVLAGAAVVAVLSIAPFLKNVFASDHKDEADIRRHVNVISGVEYSVH